MELKVASCDVLGKGGAMKQGTEPIERRVLERCAVHDRVFFLFFFLAITLFFSASWKTWKRGFAHHCSSSPRRSDTSLGTRRHSSHESHCTQASEQRGVRSACRAGEGVGISCVSSSCVPFFFFSFLPPRIVFSERSWMMAKSCCASPLLF